MLNLSIIIPTRNRSEFLNKTLESITNQTMNKSLFEVIIVDNGSTDNTKKIISDYIDKLNIKYLYEPKLGLHEGRHTGLKNASCEILVYIDDDIEAFPEWLQTIQNVFEKDKEIVLVGGKNLPKYESTPPFWILEMWNNRNEYGYVLGDLSILDFGNKEKEIPPFYVFGCNFSVKKQVIIDAGGFHPDAMPFELIRYRGDGETYISDYIKTNNLKTYYHPQASVQHMVTNDRMTEEYFFKRRYVQGISDAYTSLRNRSADNSTRIEKSRIKKYLNIILGFKQIQLLNSIKTEICKTEFQKKLELSYDNGYNYLLKSYNMDEDIKKWVHKKQYLEL
jgi:glycosyltransferase involved in cell wall biosynthesis